MLEHAMHVAGAQRSVTCNKRSFVCRAQDAMNYLTQEYLKIFPTNTGLRIEDLRTLSQNLLVTFSAPVQELRCNNKAREF